jgi:uncharacterized repeat protein (TIGR03803 family)
MKRIVNASHKLSSGKRGCAVFALCAATAIALPAQTLATLYSFDWTNGLGPQAALVQGTNGDFYGTTSQQVPNNGGTVFRVTPGGTLTTLHSFRLDGRFHARCGAGPSHQWRLLRDNARGRAKLRPH